MCTLCTKTRYFNACWRNQENIKGTPSQPAASAVTLKQEYDRFRPEKGALERIKSSSKSSADFACFNACKNQVARAARHNICQLIT